MAFLSERTHDPACVFTESVYGVQALLGNNETIGKNTVDLNWKLCQTFQPEVGVPTDLIASVFFSHNLPPIYPSHWHFGKIIAVGLFPSF